jgi:hypothetical protein
MIPGSALPDAVRRKLGFLFSDYDCRIVRERSGVVELESPVLAVQVALDPRGEVDVWVSRAGNEAVHARWTYCGMVGKASVERLLEIAGERMKLDEAILQGNPDFYERLAVENRQRAKEWTAYYSRKGPRPRSGPLP